MTNPQGRRVNADADNDGEDLLAQLGDLGGVGSPTYSASSAENSTFSGVLVEDDPLADLENLARSSPTPLSKSNTPRVSAEGSRNARNSRDSTSTRSPPISAIQSRITPSSEQQSSHPANPHISEVEGSSWWGGLVATATATATIVAKHAEAAIKDVQKATDIQGSADKVGGKGNIGVLRGLGQGIRSRALPTLNNIIDTLAPPISKHEILQVHVTHGMVGYPSIEKGVGTVFSRVMNQVEGGDLLILRRDPGSIGEQSAGDDITQRQTRRESGWMDGEWWRTNDIPATAIRRDLNAVSGVDEGQKLALGNARSCAIDYFASRNMTIEEAIKIGGVVESSDFNQTSNVFLSVQSVSHLPVVTNDTDPANKPEQDDELIGFVVYLYDPVHLISFSTISQPFPRKWADWLNYLPGSAGGGDLTPRYHPDISPIILGGGIDPREWAVDWIEDTISLAVGIIAQRYISRRMGVGAAVLMNKEVVKEGSGDGSGDDTTD